MTSRILRFSGMAIASGLLASGFPSEAGAQENPLQLRPHHITASVLDLDRAIAWYENMLGFKLKERGTHGPVQFAELVLPTFGVALVKEPYTDQPATLRGAATASGTAMVSGAAAPNARATPRRTPPYWMHIVFCTPDPDQAFKALMRKGAAVSTHAPSAATISSFLVEDSEGNEIEIVADPAR